MTIEERAKEYAKYNALNDARFQSTSINSYVAGATDQDPISRAEQKKIDIDKAIKFMVKLGLFGCEDSRYAEQFRKVMEE